MAGPRSLFAVTAVAVLGALMLAVTSEAMHGAATRPKCSVLTARDKILSSDLPQRVKDAVAGMNGGGVDQLICRDVTRDRRKDMTVLIESGGPAAVDAWVVFRNKKGRWKLALRRLRVYQASVRTFKGNLIEVSAVLLKTDDKCCPTGGYDHRRFHWKKGKFVVARFWHTKNR
jgi:hypothetical protein